MYSVRDCESLSTVRRSPVQSQTESDRQQLNFQGPEGLLTPELKLSTSVLYGRRRPLVAKRTTQTGVWIAACARCEYAAACCNRMRRRWRVLAKGTPCLLALAALVEHCPPLQCPSCCSHCLTVWCICRPQRVLSGTLCSVLGAMMQELYGFTRTRDVTKV
jgi:hypothetical protein